MPAQLTHFRPQFLEFLARPVIFERQVAERIEKPGDRRSAGILQILGEGHQGREGRRPAKNFRCAPALFDRFVVVFPDEDEAGMGGQDRV